MQDDVASLRDQANRARRLAVGGLDAETSAELRRFADECDVNADRLEAENAPKGGSD